MRPAISCERLEHNSGHPKASSGSTSLHLQAAWFLGCTLQTNYHDVLAFFPNDTARRGCAPWRGKWPSWRRQVTRVEPDKAARSEGGSQTSRIPRPVLTGGGRCCVKVDHYSADAHTLLPLVPWVARSSRESGRPSSSRHHSQVTAVRCAAAPVFSLAQLRRVTAIWCPQMVFVPAGPRWTLSEQHVGRLDHDRTERHWQSPVFTPEGYSGTPRHVS